MRCSAFFLFQPVAGRLSFSLYSAGCPFLHILPVALFFTFCRLSFSSHSDRLPFFSHSSRLSFSSHSGRLSFSSHSGRLPFSSLFDRSSAIPFFLFSLPIGKPPYLFSLSFARTFRNFFLSPFPPHAAAFFLLSLEGRGGRARVG